MSVDTLGKIRGFAKHEDILNFIRQKWDKNAKSSIKREIICPVSECNWEHKINEHSDDNENWYIISGSIVFEYNNEKRMLFYVYNNVNHYENLEFYSKHNLRDMVETETTHISLGHWGNSVEIIKEIVAHFGGGWIDEDDCDDKEYYPIRTNPDGSIKPVQYVTMEDIYEKFGSVVVITD